MAYDIDNYATLGLLWETLSVDNIEQPAAADLARVRDCLRMAVEDIGTSTDLSGRLGAANREASSRVREKLRAQW
ncbi:biotin-independent malonate decarboxylase subunit gamma, partial [Stutzerimonas nitrititolerans]